jgi:putative membrane protein
MLRVTLAALHLLGFGLGAFAILTRAIVVRPPVSGITIRRAFRADNLWAASAAILVITGLWRYLGGAEKATAYYTHNEIFVMKMMLLAIILGLEVWPMITLIRWRIALGRGATPESVVTPRRALRISTISFVQAAIMAAMVFAAVAMARGYSVL